MSNNAAELKVKKLAKLPSNQVCPNCATRSKHGFSTVCVKFHTFVCNNCKSSHQAISHRCKSLTMSTWTMSEVEELAAKGNDHARHTWLATAPPVGSGGRPCSTSDLNVFKSFVVNAYERKLYYSNESGSEVQQRQQNSAAPRPTLANVSSQPTPEEAPVADLLDFSAPPTSTTTATSTTNDDFAFFSADFGDFSTAAPPPPPPPAVSSGVLLKPPPTSSTASKHFLLPPPPSCSSVPVDAGSTLVTPSFPKNNNCMNNATATYMSTTRTTTTMNGKTNGAHAISNMMAPTNTTTMMNASGFHPGPTGNVPIMMNGYTQPMNHGGNGFQTTMSMNTGMSMNQSMMNSGMSMNTGMPMNQAMMNAGVNTGMSMNQAMNTNIMNSSFPQNGFGQQQQQPPPPMMYHPQGMQVTRNMNNSTTTLGTNSNNTNKDHDPFAGLGGF